MLDAMLPYLVGSYGNPHSRTHAYGWESEAAVEKARQVKLAIVLCIWLSQRLVYEFNEIHPHGCCLVGCDKNGVF